MKRIFIHAKTIGDFNRVTYNNRPHKNGKRNETRINYYFIPRDDSNKIEIESILKRGKQFFSKKEGFLFGAYYELTKLGEIKAVEVY